MAMRYCENINTPTCQLPPLHFHRLHLPGTLSYLTSRPSCSYLASAPSFSYYFLIKYPLIFLSDFLSLFLNWLPLSFPLIPFVVVPILNNLPLLNFFLPDFPYHSLRVLMYCSSFAFLTPFFIFLVNCPPPSFS